MMSSLPSSSTIHSTRITQPPSKHTHPALLCARAVCQHFLPRSTRRTPPCPPLSPPSPTADATTTTRTASGASPKTTTRSALAPTASPSSPCPHAATLAPCAASARSTSWSLTHVRDAGLQGGASGWAWRGAERGSRAAWWCLQPTRALPRAVSVSARTHARTAFK